MYTCEIRINAKLVKEGDFRINAKLVKEELKGLAQAKIIKKSVILFWVVNMTIWCKHVQSVQRLELQFFFIFVLRIHQLG